jgi:hypothetical protein
MLLVVLQIGKAKDLSAPLRAIRQTVAAVTSGLSLTPRENNKNNITLSLKPIAYLLSQHTIVC